MQILAMENVLYDMENVWKLVVNVVEPWQIYHLKPSISLHFNKCLQLK